MNTKLNRRFIGQLLPLFALSLIPFTLDAITRTSDGGAWNNPYNWVPMGVPEDGDDIMIAGDVDIDGYEINLSDVTITIQHTGRLIFREDFTFCPGFICVDLFLADLDLSGNSGIIVESGGQITYDGFFGFLVALDINGETVWNGGEGPLTGPETLPATFLPVELVSFSGTPLTNSRVDLQWTTLSELNNEGFEIQRSHDAEDWEYISFMAGQGTTNTATDYAFRDQLNPGVEEIYYRLKQLDFDGSFEFTPIIHITLESSSIAKLTLYPNPSQENLTISGAAGKAVVYNALGRVMRQFTLQNGTSSWDISEFPAGTYVLRVNSENGIQINQQFIKQ